MGCEFFGDCGCNIPDPVSVSANAWYDATNSNRQNYAAFRYIDYSKPGFARFKHNCTYYTDSTLGQYGVGVNFDGAELADAGDRYLHFRYDISDGSYQEKTANRFGSYTAVDESHFVSRRLRYGSLWDTSTMSYVAAGVSATPMFTAGDFSASGFFYYSGFTQTWAASIDTEITESIYLSDAAQLMQAGGAAWSNGHIQQATYSTSATPSAPAYNIANIPSPQPYIYGSVFHYQAKSRYPGQHYFGGQVLNVKERRARIGVYDPIGIAADSTRKYYVLANAFAVYQPQVPNQPPPGTTTDYAPTSLHFIGKKFFELNATTGDLLEFYCPPGMSMDLQVLHLTQTELHAQPGPGPTVNPNYSPKQKLIGVKSMDGTVTLSIFTGEPESYNALNVYGSLANLAAKACVPYGPDPLADIGFTPATLNFLLQTYVDTPAAFPAGYVLSTCYFYCNSPYTYSITVS